MVKVEKCYINDSNYSSIQQTNKTKKLEVLQSKIVGCKGQAIITASGTKKLIVKGCHFVDNCSDRTTQDGAISLTNINSVIQNTIFENNKAVGILMQGGKGDFHCIIVRNSVCGFVLRGAVSISSSILQGCAVGLNLEGGNVTLKDNKMIHCVQEITRYDKSLEPVFLGDSRHRVSSVNADMLIGAEMKHRKRERRKNLLPTLGFVD